MPHSDDLARLWPAASVRARSGDLELRWIDDGLLVELAELASRGVHAPDAMPFEHPWTRGTPEDVARSVLTYQWALRGRLSPDNWALELAVVHEGTVVGVQGLVADDWSVLRTVKTGSWLGIAHQGRSIGTRMRILALHLAFDGLDALEAHSGAFVDNPSSNAVSRRVGYDHDGAFRIAREGAAVWHNRYVMSRERCESLRLQHANLLGAPIELTGVDGLRGMIEAQQQA
ncbi:GNAT family N-acetyltransferase [Microbacterium sp. CPCC 204701]|uniref:GNAT family N-acetyltransferase n=1 Tax=Microbacterium sp. CPCC 204701 TaxID=2493084 RepID=UPI000FD873EF|nr:GNAT family protein [Microbacterium sp. CPCC 204701]